LLFVGFKDGNGCDELFVFYWINMVIVGKKEVVVATWIAAAMIWIVANTHSMTPQMENGWSEHTTIPRFALP
jgi:hypothetical protein